jgi:hypothetical protein
VVKLKRYDSFMDAGWTDPNLDLSATDRFYDEMQNMLEGMAEIARPARGDETANVMILYGVGRRDDSPIYAVAVIDQNAEVQQSLQTAQSAEIRPALEAQLRRGWLAINLMRIRQPINSQMTLDLSLTDTSEKEDTRGVSINYRRSRYKVGERVAFTIRPSSDGYLTLINIDCNGGVAILYPNAEMTQNTTGFVRAGDVVRIPSETSYFLEVEEPVGKEVIKALLTPAPLVNLAKAAENFDATPGGSVTLMRGLGAELQSKVGVKKEGEAGRLDFSLLNTDNWAEAYLEFHTSR